MRVVLLQKNQHQLNIFAQQFTFLDCNIVLVVIIIVIQELVKLHYMSMCIFFQHAFFVKSYCLNISILDAVFYCFKTWLSAHMGGYLRNVLFNCASPPMGVFITILLNNCDPALKFYKQVHQLAFLAEQTHMSAQKKLFYHMEIYESSPRRVGGQMDQYGTVIINFMQALMVVSNSESVTFCKRKRKYTQLKGRQPLNKSPDIIQKSSGCCAKMLLVVAKIIKLFNATL
eukprot:TRINITY_DN3900_c2_g1_i3.p1 TRINITY_DN3900_c2_g1~~TRINITY_DN3900_c2_g1_i3.p1  ORF type:complete len:229 (-),score=-0.66 TRINITY_DN3900_c2_g1_i3:168-854(-)